MFQQLVIRSKMASIILGRRLSRMPRITSKEPREKTQEKIGEDNGVHLTPRNEERRNGDRQHSHLAIHNAYIHLPSPD